MIKEQSIIQIFYFTAVCAVPFVNIECKFLALAVMMCLSFYIDIFIRFKMINRLLLCLQFFLFSYMIENSIYYLWFILVFIFTYPVVVVCKKLDEIISHYIILFFWKNKVEL